MSEMQKDNETAEQKINVLFAEIERLNNDAKNKNRADEIEKRYADIERLQEEAGLEKTVLLEYASFLAGIDKYDTAIEKYSQELARCRKLAETNPQQYLAAVAKALDGLAEMQYVTYRNKEAEENYRELQGIYQKLKEINPDDYWEVAKTPCRLEALQAGLKNQPETSGGNDRDAGFANTELIEKNDFVGQLAYTLCKACHFKKETERKGLAAAAHNLNQQKTGQQDIFEYGIQLILDNMDAKAISQTLSGLISMEQDENYRRLKLIQKEAVLDIKKGRRNSDKRLLWNLLVSYINNAELAAVFKRPSCAFLLDEFFYLNCSDLEEEKENRAIERTEFMERLVQIVQKTCIWYEKARLEGLLALADELDHKNVQSRDVFEYGIVLAIFRIDPEYINMILSNIIACEKNNDIRILKTIQKESVLSIQAGDAFQALYKAIVSNVSDSELEYLRTEFSGTSIFDTFLHRIKAYLRQDQYDLAIESYNEAIKDSPLNKALYKELGKIYYTRGKFFEEQGQCDEAIEDYIEAVKLDPVKTYCMKCAEACYKERDYVFAIRYFTDAIMLETDDFFKHDIYNKRGDAYYKNSQYELAINDYTEAVRLDQSSFSLHIYYDKRGGAYYKNGQYELAIADYTEAIRLFEYSHDYYNMRGIAYLNNGQYDLAISDFTEAIKLAPYIASFHGNRGFVYGKRNQYFPAIDDFTQAIELDPDDLSCYSERADLCKCLGLYELAIEDYAEAIRRNPDNYSWYNIRGITYSGLKQYDLAIADYSEAIRLQPNDENLYYNRGSAYFKKGLYDMAIDDFSESIRIDPDNKDAYNYRASAYRKKEQEVLAAARITEAANKNPEGAHVLAQEEIDRMLAELDFGGTESGKSNTDDYQPVSSKESLTAEDIERLLAALHEPLKPDMDHTRIPLSIVIARQNFPLITIKELDVGNILEFDKPIEYPADLYVADAIVARGEVILLGDNFGIRIIEIHDIGDTATEQATPDIEQTETTVSIVLGEKNELLNEIQRWGKGVILELNKTIDKDMDVYAGGECIAQGEIVDSNDCFGIKITEMKERGR